MDCKGVQKRKRNRNQICGIEDLFSTLRLSSIIKAENHLNIISSKSSNQAHSIEYTKFVKAQTNKINHFFPYIKECKVVIQKHFLYSNVNLISSSSFLKKEVIMPCILSINKVNDALSVLNVKYKYDHSLYNHHLIICTNTLSKNFKTKKRRNCANEYKANLKPLKAGVQAKRKICKNNIISPNVLNLATTLHDSKQRRHIKFTRLNKPNDSPSKFSIMPCDMPNCKGELSCKSQGSEINYDSFNNKALTCKGLAYCALGCLCNSLDNSGKHRAKGHCNNYACGFGCKCGYEQNLGNVLVRNGSSRVVARLDEKRNRKLPLVFRDNSFILHPHIKVSRREKNIVTKVPDLLIASNKSKETLIPAEEQTTLYPCTVIIKNVYDPVVSLILSR